jgi:hypothetical protein
MALPMHDIDGQRNALVTMTCRRADQAQEANVANSAGVSRVTLYRARDGRVSADTAEILTLIVRAFEAGKLRFRRSSPQPIPQSLGSRRGVTTCAHATRFAIWRIYRKNHH